MAPAPTGAWDPVLRGALRGTLRGALLGAMDLILPAACAVCHRSHAPEPDGIVCPSCIAGIVPLGYPQCGRCGHPRLSLAMALPVPQVSVDQGTDRAAAGTAAPLPPCRWCGRLDPSIRAVRSAARMDGGTGADLVHALKYRGWSRAAHPMARAMARLEWPEDVMEEGVALVPVPLSATRARERGYNQAECLAKALAPRWRLPVWNDVLVRTRATQSQVRLTPSERAGNVSGAFTVPMHRRTGLRGQHIILVDDVVTTAATLNAAVQALVEGGARIISCATFGRAPDPGDRAAPDPDFIRN